MLHLLKSVAAVRFLKLGTQLVNYWKCNNINVSIDEWYLLQMTAPFPLFMNLNSWDIFYNINFSLPFLFPQRNTESSHTWMCAACGTSSWRSIVGTHKVRRLKCINYHITELILWLHKIYRCWIKMYTDQDINTVSLSRRFHLWNIKWDTYMGRHVHVRAQICSCMRMLYGKKITIKSLHTKYNCGM